MSPCGSDISSSNTPCPPELSPPLLQFPTRCHSLLPVLDFGSRVRPFLFSFTFSTGHLSFTFFLAIHRVYCAEHLFEQSIAFGASFEHYQNRLDGILWIFSAFSWTSQAPSSSRSLGLVYHISTHYLHIDQLDCNHEVFRHPFGFCVHFDCGRRCLGKFGSRFSSVII